MEETDCCDSIVLMRNFLKSRRALQLFVVVNVVLIIINIFVLARGGANNSPITEESSKYPYLSKRVFIENQNDILINFVGLRSVLREYVSTQKAKIGVYFEYLPSGTSIGVNDTREFAQASLVKVPIVMTAYKFIEQGKIDINQKLTIRPELIDKKFGDLWRKGAGAQVTVAEAIRLSLVESDNTAAKLLIAALPVGEVDKLFDSLDIPRRSIDNSPFISPKSYSSIFRSLYLASTISVEHSNAILEHLSRSLFKDQLVAGVSGGNIKIAHKIGEYQPDNNPSQTFYSDCGIIYVPSRPYMLCVMTEDVSKTKADEYIRTISKLTYEFVTLVNQTQH